MLKKKLPVGVEDFKKLILQNNYYVDKTDFIAQTFKDEVALYTRPRRFGKTLNMSMLKYFYSIKEKPESEERDLFQGLDISRNEEAKTHQNSYPVISLSFKDVEGETFEEALQMLSLQIKKLVNTVPELLDSGKLSIEYKEQLQVYKKGTTDPFLLSQSLWFLSMCLTEHYNRKTIILIDEYDVPLDKAFQYNYYAKMIRFIRTFLSSALKTNDSLEKAILTGCLRISQESIFTGLNNLSVYSVMDDEAASAFGFTQEEVNQMYEAYGFADKLPEVRKWYDGYLFGNIEIYNPWSTLQYLKALLTNPDKKPAFYWANSSSNYLITRYIENADDQMMADFQALADGKSIIKKIRPDLTYREMEDPDNVYSFLLLTGYLKAVKEGAEEKTWELKIPNLEVRDIYKDHFSRYFGKLKKALIPELFAALKREDEKQIKKVITKLLDRYISFYDGRENFYHGFMNGIFAERYGWEVLSNREAGDGRYDLCLTSDITDLKTMIVLEYKKSDDKNDMVKDAENGVKQIVEKRYLDNELARDYPVRIGYGISFYKKSCRVEKV